MLRRGVSFLCLCIAAMQLLVHQSSAYQHDPEYRAKLEEKVMTELSLRDLESLVENDERVLNVPQGRIVIVPRPKDGRSEEGAEAIVIERKPKVVKKVEPKVESKAEFRKVEEEGPNFRFSNVELAEEEVRRSGFDPAFDLESPFRQAEEFPSLFRIDDLESADSAPVERFYESIVESVLRRQDPMDILRAVASEDVPQYAPRFDYDTYSKDSTEEKLKGKPYWKETPERREELVDENGCRTVVKKVVDPEDAKKPGAKAKSVVITKECEAPALDAPDAKLYEAPPFKLRNSPRIRFPLFSGSGLDGRPSAYERDRPDELDIKKSDGDQQQADPLAHDYIDRMLEKHFKSFNPGFSNPLSSFSGYQERFKLQVPEKVKDVKPTVQVEAYEYDHPESGLEGGRDESRDEYDRRQRGGPARQQQQAYEHGPSGSRYDDGRQQRRPAAGQQGPVRDDTPKAYDDERQHRQRPAAFQQGPIRDDAPKAYEHHYHYDHYPESDRDYSEKEDVGKTKAVESKGEEEKQEKPKMMKKSFAYYRKDNPKDDPDDHQYAEEYGTGNYRSFSSSYDSEKDGPKKKQKQ